MAEKGRRADSIGQQRRDMQPTMKQDGKDEGGGNAGANQSAAAARVRMISNMNGGQ
ncbi:hypothetical protein D3C87_2051220 [compost metagenome]